MFFQNVFNETYRGSWVLGDRQYSITFEVPPNPNTSNHMLAWNSGPYDLSSVDELTINYAWDAELKNYSELTIDISGAVPAATTVEEIVTILNANTTFAELWRAELYPHSLTGVPTDDLRILITVNPARAKKLIRTWISNTGAETILRFNKRAGVAELPSYFERHTIENRFTFPDSTGDLILLDESDTDDQNIIEDAGFTPGDMLEDWELLKGRSGLFKFQKLTIDVSNRITEIIEYPAGAEPGALARKTKYTYAGSNTNPSTMTEEPYTLQSGDLVTP